MNIFNNRSLGQKKRKAKKDLAEGLVGCIGIIFLWSIKVLFFPITFTYYGFLKKNVSKNWKLFYRVLFVLMLILFTYNYFSIEN